jgi:hypothetical protein
MKIYDLWSMIYVHLLWHIGQFFLELEIFQKLIVDNIKTYILFSTNFFSENRDFF